MRARRDHPHHRAGAGGQANGGAARRPLALKQQQKQQQQCPAARRGDLGGGGGGGDDGSTELLATTTTTTTTRRAALASLGLWAGGARAAGAAATPQLQPPLPATPACSLLGLPSGTADDATGASGEAARLLYDGPGPFLALSLPRLEHTCAPCFPASCVGDRCLQSIFVTYPRPLARRPTADASPSSPLLDPLAAPYPLAVISGGFLLGSDAYASLAARLATWGYVAVRYDRRDGLTDLLDDASCAELLLDLLLWCSRDPLLRRVADPSRTLLVGHSRGCKVGALAALRLQEEERREAAEERSAAAERAEGAQQQVVLRARRRASGEEAAEGGNGGGGGGGGGERCAAVVAAEAALDAGNAAAEAEALRSVGGGGGAGAGAAVAAPILPSNPRSLPARKRPLPRVVGLFCLDPVDATKYAPESPRFPSALALMRRRAAAEQEEEVREREAAEAAAALKQQQQQQQQQRQPRRQGGGRAGAPAASASSSSAAAPSSSPPVVPPPSPPLPRISGVPFAIVGAAAGADCAPPGSNYAAWFEQVPGPAVEVVIPGAGHLAFLDPPGGGGGNQQAGAAGAAGAGGGGGGGGAGGADGGTGAVGGGTTSSLARSVCSVGTADEAEVRRASMALAVAFAEGVTRRGGQQGGVLAALAEQRCAPPTGAAPSPAAPSDDDDDDDAVLRSTREAMERTLAHLRANPPSGRPGGAAAAAAGPAGGSLRTRWRGFPAP